MDAIRLGELDAALRSLTLSPTSYLSKVFRIVIPLYANKVDALSGQGSRGASGRFHVKGAFLISYTGCTLRQAEWEYAHTARNNAITREDSLPLITLSADVALSKVLDLTDRVVRRQLKVTKKELSQGIWNASSGETLTQVIGRLAHQQGFEAILTPSAGPGNNLNLLPPPPTP